MINQTVPDNQTTHYPKYQSALPVSLLDEFGLHLQSLMFVKE